MPYIKGLIFQLEWWHKILFITDGRKIFLSVLSVSVCLRLVLVQFLVCSGRRDWNLASDWNWLQTDHGCISRYRVEFEEINIPSFPYIKKTTMTLLSLESEAEQNNPRQVRSSIIMKFVFELYWETDKLWPKTSLLVWKNIETGLVHLQSHQYCSRLLLPKLLEEWKPQRMSGNSSVKMTPKWRRGEKTRVLPTLLARWAPSS